MDDTLILAIGGNMFMHNGCFRYTNILLEFRNYHTSHNIATRLHRCPDRHLSRQTKCVAVPKGTKQIQYKTDMNKNNAYKYV